MANAPVMQNKRSAVKHLTVKKDSSVVLRPSSE
jgi:hypothetical protein